MQSFFEIPKATRQWGQYAVWYRSRGKNLYDKKERRGPGGSRRQVDAGRSVSSNPSRRSASWVTESRSSDYSADVGSAKKQRRAVPLFPTLINYSAATVGVINLRGDTDPPAGIPAPLTNVFFPLNRRKPPLIRSLIGCWFLSSRRWSWCFDGRRLLFVCEVDS